MNYFTLALIALAGIVLGIAQLLKFSIILLFPFFGILVIIWAAANSSGFREFLKIFKRYFVFCLLIGLIAFLSIWIVYQYHTWEYPPEKQLSDTQDILASFDIKFLSNLNIWMADKPVFRPIGQYLLGLFMIFQRAAGGNTGFFLGEVSATGWKSYFPVVYFIKEPLSFHILTLITLICLVFLIKKLLWQKPLLKVISSWTKLHFVELASLIFIAIYWITSLSSTLNIGVRHLLPVFPFTILLISGNIVAWSSSTPFSKLKKALLAWLLLWQAYSIILIYPHFLAYFNESIGKTDQGYMYTVDSNLDWGQDLKRLNQWLDEKGIDKIYIDYFGGGSPEYYLKGKNAPWWGAKNPEEMPKGSYLAVSATFIQRGQGKPASNFNEPTGYYNWLNEYKLVKKIGYSIFVYYID